VCSKVCSKVTLLLVCVFLKEKLPCLCNPDKFSKGNASVSLLFSLFRV
jgi:hypothetical protein